MILIGADSDLTDGKVRNSGMESGVSGKTMKNVGSRCLKITCDSKKTDERKYLASENTIIHRERMDQDPIDPGGDDSLAEKKHKIPNENNFGSRPLCSTRSNALEMSSETN